MKPILFAIALLSSITSFGTIGFTIQGGANLNNGPVDNSSISKQPMGIAGSAEARGIVRLGHFDFGLGAATGGIHHAKHSRGWEEYAPISYNSIYLYCNYRIFPYRDLYYYAGGLIGSMNTHAVNTSRALGSAYGVQVGAGYQVAEEFAFNLEFAMRNCHGSFVHAKYLPDRDYVLWYYHFEAGFTVATPYRKKKTHHEPASSF